MRHLLRPSLLALAASLLVAAGASPDPFESVGRVDHPPISEMSGIVRSRTYPDVWWVHNDSGDEARLFAIDARGAPILPEYVRDRYSVGPATEEGKEPWPGLRLLGASNVDWEDLALADGTIYVADMGNNGNARRDLGVYVVPEPNPRATETMRPLRFLPIAYPDQDGFPPKRWQFDCESLFVSDGKLYFLTKHRLAGVNQPALGTKLYRLDTEHTDRVNVLTLVESRADLALPTAADLSPDGKRLAVLTVLSLWVFEKPETGDHWLSGKARRLLLPRARTKQAEGVCWDDDRTLRLCSEDRDLFRVPLAAFEAPAEAGEKR